MPKYVLKRGYVLHDSRGNVTHTEADGPLDKSEIPKDQLYRCRLDKAPADGKPGRYTRPKSRGDHPNYNTPKPRKKRRKKVS